MQELSQTHILCYRSQHWLLISANTVSLQPPHSVTQQLLMACIQQQQPVSAALYTALIKCSALYCMWGLKKVRYGWGGGYCHLKHSTITPIQTERFRLTHLTLNPPGKCIKGGWNTRARDEETAAIRSRLTTPPADTEAKEARWV